MKVVNYKNRVSRIAIVAIMLLANLFPLAANAVSLGSPSSAIEYFRGKVGIGTSTPSTALDVVGDTKLAGNLQIGDSLSSYSAVIKQGIYPYKSFLYYEDDGTGYGPAWIHKNTGAGGTTHPTMFLRTRGNKAILNVNDSIGLGAMVSNGTVGGYPIITTDTYISGAQGVNSYFNNNANVGIGTTVPAQKLYVQSGNIGVSSGNLIGWGSTLTENLSASGATHHVSIATNSIERMRVDGNGKVAIGKNIPIDFVDIYAPNNGAGLTVADSRGAIRLATQNNVNYLQSGLSYSLDSKADLRFSSVGGATSWMTIKGNSGNVGINTINPTVKLEILASEKGNNAWFHGLRAAGDYAFHTDLELGTWAPGNGPAPFPAAYKVKTADDRGYGSLSFQSTRWGSNVSFDHVINNGGTLAQIMLLSGGRSNYDATNGKILHEGMPTLSIFDEVGSARVVHFATRGTSYLNGGNLGIGTKTPQAKLDVVGTVKISGATTTGSLVSTGNIIGFGSIGANGALTGASVTTAGTVTANALKVTGGSPAVGKVLVSDAVGNASWATLASIGAAAAAPVTTVEYTSPTTTTWTVPAGVTSIKVKVWGPGGNGGLGSNYFVSGAPGAGAGGGGGSGAYAEKIITIPAGTTSYPVVVGTPGTASSFAGTLVVAGSGGNAANASGQSGGAGGTAGIASGSAGLDVNVGGLTGNTGGSGSYGQCSGGYSLAGNGGNGANGISGVGLGTSGGGAGGVGAGCPNVLAVGVTANTVGAGGGGASGYQTTSPAAGAPGKVVIEYGGNLSPTIVSNVLTNWPDAIICGSRVQYLEIVDKTAGVRYRGLDGAYTIFNSSGAFVNNYVGSTCPSWNVAVQQQKAN